jgi:general secretion pathway protein G
MTNNFEIIGKVSPTVNEQRLRNLRGKGFTLIEIIIVILIIGTIAMIAVPTYRDYILRANIAQATADIVNISNTIDGYYVDNKNYPDTLATIGVGALQDPWGNAYEYLRISTAEKNAPRQDRNLKPVNSDYDLYSKGADGLTHRTFTARKGRDDIVRANDGAYIGLANDY